MAKKSSKKGGITPIGDRVLVKSMSEDELSTKTASGIIIPDTVDKEKSEQGTVIAVGEGKLVDGKLVKTSVKEGDKILYGWGRDVKVDGEEYVLVKGEDILAIIK